MVCICVYVFVGAEWGIYVVKHPIPTIFWVTVTILEFALHNSTTWSKIMYVCDISTYVSTYVRTYYMCTHTHTHTQACTCVCMHIHVCKHTVYTKPYVLISQELDLVCGYQYHEGKLYSHLLSKVLPVKCCFQCWSWGTQRESKEYLLLGSSYYHMLTDMYMMRFNSLLY
jgi:hypothetical protein